MARANRSKAVVVLTVLTGLLLLVGRLVGGQGGMLVALVPAVAVVAVACWFSEWLVLRLAGAAEVPRTEAPELYALVGELVERAALPMPRIFAVEVPAPNAFAVGRDARHAVIGVTTGLLELLDPEEGAAVIAHELGHVANGDALTGGMLAAVIYMLTLPLQLAMQAIQWVIDVSRSYGGSHDWSNHVFARPRLMAWMAPIIGPALCLLARPDRELRADAFAARLVGSPLPLANALERLAPAAPIAELLDVDPALHHLLFAEPTVTRSWFGLISTRPRPEQRLEQLRLMA